jgi:lipopolysaccharide transport system permease protein
METREMGIGGADGAKTSATSVTVIKPPKRVTGISIRELFEYRTLLFQLSTRRFKTQFEDQYLGLVWAVARPLLMMVVFVTFKNLSSARVGEEIPYFLYLYTGLIVWFYFTQSVVEISASVKQDIGIIKKVYYPKIISPLSVLFGNFLIFCVSAIPLGIMMVVFGQYPGWHIIMLPLVIAQLALFMLGLGALFAALSLQGRDWEQLLTFALYIGLFISPVIFAPSIVPDPYKPLLFANPMAGTLGAFRASFFGAVHFPWEAWVYSCGFTLLVVLGGVAAFQSAEGRFSETL